MCSQYSATSASGGAREVVDHFDSIAPVYYDVVDAYETGLSYYHRQELETAVGWADRLGARTVLDAGCGPGRLTLRLLADGKDVVSVDVSRMMLRTLRDFARSSGHADLKEVHASAAVLPFSTGSFDLIVCTEVLEHLPRFPQDGLSMIGEMSRVLRPGGHLVLEFPLVAHSLLRRLPQSTVPWSSFANPKWESVPRPSLRFQRRFWRSEVERLMRRSGFSIVARRFIRVIPSGYVQRTPALAKLDSLLERIPLARSLGREIVVVARNSRSG